MKPEREFSVFPRDARKYYERARDEMDRIDFHEDILTDKFGIRWYEIAKPSASGEKPLKKIMYLAPHSDDRSISGAVTCADAIQEGHLVDEILITCGSSGRSTRGFDDVTMPPVRLWEAYQAAQHGEIHRLGVLFETSRVASSRYNIGLREWFRDYNDGAYAELGVAMMRRYNPHIIYSPHPNPKVDTHPDHILTAELARWGAGWGTEVSFYNSEYPSPYQVNLESWRTYAVWEGSEKLPWNYRTEYDPGGVFAHKKLAEIDIFESQGGVNYAKTALARDEYIGGMVTVGDDEHMAFEVFHDTSGPGKRRP